MKRSGDLSTSGRDFELEAEKPVKTSFYNPAFHFDRRPMFSSRNYTPIVPRPISRSGYPLTSAFYDYATRSRSRALSEDRTARSMYDYTRSRSASPTPSSLRTYRILPESHYYEERPRATSVFPRSKYLETRNTAPVLSSYESAATPHQRSYYYTRTKTEPFIYTPRTLSRPVTDAYTRSRYVDESLSNDMNSLSRNSRNNTMSSTSPYEGYSSYSSNYGSRSFSTYTPVDLPSARSTLGSSISSTLRYPALYPATFRHSYLTGLKAC